MRLLNELADNAILKKVRGSSERDDEQVRPWPSFSYQGGVVVHLLDSTENGLASSHCVCRMQFAMCMRAINEPQSLIPPSQQLDMQGSESSTPMQREFAVTRYACWLLLCLC